MVPAVVSISYFNYAVVAFVGGLMVVNGWTDPGSLASYLVFVRQAAAPINHFTQHANFLLSSLAGAERIFSLMDEKSEEDEGKVDLEKTSSGWAWVSPSGGKTPLKGDVRFENVTFGYTPGENVLNGIKAGLPRQMRIDVFGRN